MKGVACLLALLALVYAFGRIEGQQAAELKVWREIRAALNSCEVA